MKNLIDSTKAKNTRFFKNRKMFQRMLHCFVNFDDVIIWKFMCQTKPSWRKCKHRSHCFGIMGSHELFFNVGHTVSFPSLKCLTCGAIKMNITIMLLNLVRCLNILLLQTTKTDNNAPDIDAIYNLKLRKI
jgi:hypothetical protein